MTININVAEVKELKPRILVLGVGGAGGNAINGMIDSGLQGVEFVAVNTDAQDLRTNKAQAKIQIGHNLTRGLGAGSRTDVGEASADESLNEIINYLQGSNMVFITAGMGGGTGTGAAHVIARAAKELNILTVGVVTLPFLYEGPGRMKRAMVGLTELKKHVDTNIVIPNQNLFKIASEKTTFEESFDLSNRVLKHGVQSVTDLMVRPGLINLDFADVETVMKGKGKAMMGTGESDGDKRATKAAEFALNNPLIDEYSLKGAKGLLINITGGKDLTLFEVDEAVNKVRAEVDSEAELIIGAITDPTLEGKMRVSIVATALDGQAPETKSVVSMVGRINNRSLGSTNQETKTNGSIIDVINNNVSSATEGATALNLDPVVEQQTETKENSETKETQKKEESILGNISMENASYFENREEASDVENLPEFELDSIEQVAPALFSEDATVNLDNNKETQFEEKQEESDPSLFDDIVSQEEKYEIPAFLRRQKN
jgi:cell division protein FtsZ